MTGGEEEVEEQVLMEVEEAEIDRLPIDLLAHIFTLITCFKDLAQYIFFSPQFYSFIPSLFVFTLFCFLEKI